MATNAKKERKANNKASREKAAAKQEANKAARKANTRTMLRPKLEMKMRNQDAKASVSKSPTKAASAISKVKAGGENLRLAAGAVAGSKKVAKTVGLAARATPVGAALTALSLADDGGKAEAHNKRMGEERIAQHKRQAARDAADKAPKPDAKKPVVKDLKAKAPAKETKFGDAFKSAKAAGKKEFEWNGKKYTTKSKDESSKGGSFKEAFKTARGAGKKDFMWNGKKYTTETKK